ncbi:hypothetical protein LSAT2_000945, partial [Lamellibrachia satsuma]
MTATTAMYTLLQLLQSIPCYNPHPATAATMYTPLHLLHTTPSYSCCTLHPATAATMYSPLHLLHTTPSYSCYNVLPTTPAAHYTQLQLLQCTPHYTCCTLHPATAATMYTRYNCCYFHMSFKSGSGYRSSKLQPALSYSCCYSCCELHYSCDTSHPTTTAAHKISQHSQHPPTSAILSNYSDTMEGFKKGTDIRPAPDTCPVIQYDQVNWWIY